MQLFFDRKRLERDPILGAVGVGPHRELVRVRRLRREVPAVRDQRAAAEALGRRIMAVELPALLLPTVA